MNIESESSSEYSTIQTWFMNLLDQEPETARMLQVKAQRPIASQLNVSEETVGRVLRLLHNYESPISRNIVRAFWEFLIQNEEIHHLKSIPA